MAAPEGEEPNIVEEEEEREAKGSRRSQPDGKRSSSPPLSTSTSRHASPSFPAKAFSFWARLTLLVSAVTLLAAFLYSFRPKDDRSWFLGLPHDLRRHYSQGRLIKAQVGPGGPSVEVFAVEHGPRGGETILLLHGLGCSSYSFRDVLRSLGSRGLRAVAIDLPGAGFSGLTSSRGERWGGALGWAWDLYSDIRDKGLFWGFDQLIETGQIPYEDNKVRAPASNNHKNPVYGSEGMSRIVGQVINSLALVPVHLVLHDSALGVGAAWVTANPGSVGSITLVDSSSESAAFPSWIIGVPLLSKLVLHSHFVFAGILKLCCSRSMDGAAAEAYLHLLNGRNGRWAVVEAGRSLNFSFSVGDWAASEAMKDVPLQVLWSNTWSDGWIDEGRHMAEAVPHAKFVNHFGGRWPQEGASDEIVEKISEFVSSLPKSVKQIEQEPFPEHIQKMFDEDSESTDHHHHGHNHDHHAGSLGAYGFGHGWGSAMDF
uniref:Protein AUXIN RESPONSE 4 n=1 Tax=Anthurium amnicola TaxID=1678845 RepID=A0A1D1YBD3_9ARAE